MAPMKSVYRPEIDGLRAVAVAGVVLFHLKLEWFKGGFTGVDIFFVISGYLITRNILVETVAGSFSFGDFYIRRARRILPALIFTVAATFIAGLLFLSPVTLRGVAKESTHALLSISNIQYWKESSSYFAQASDQLPLLHCWSLSLEEQFYLVWPCLILLGARFRKSTIVIGVAAIASLGLAAVWAARDPQAVFFLMPFRIFEFAIGAAVIFMEDNFRPSAKLSTASGAFGLALIAVSVILLDQHSTFLLVTLLPNLGAAAVIYGGRGHAFSAVLSSRAVNAVGRASYSLYLCHWPIIYFARIIFGDAAHTWSGVGINLLVMIATGFAMRRFIEAPFRRADPSTSNRSSALKFMSLIAVIVAMTHGTFLAGGLSWRLNPEQLAETRLLDFGMPRCERADGKRCAFGDLHAPLGLELIGDSLAQQYVAGLDSVLKARRMRGEVSEIVGCPILVGMHSKNPFCQETLANEMLRVRSTSSFVIIGQDWLKYRNGSPSVTDTPPLEVNETRFSVVGDRLERTIEYLADNDRKFLIIGAQIRMPQCVFDDARMRSGPFRRSTGLVCESRLREDVGNEGYEINAMLSKVQKKWPDRVQLLIPVDVFCDAECPAAHDGVSLFFDSNHFNAAGSIYVVTRANKLLMKFLDQKKRVN